MLDVSNGANAVQVPSNVSTEYVLQQLTRDGRERDRTVVSWVLAFQKLSVFQYLLKGSLGHNGILS